jgi:hypothetical protein
LLGTPMAFISWLISDKQVPTLPAAAPPLPTNTLRPDQVWRRVCATKDAPSWPTWFNGRIVSLGTLRRHQDAIWCRVDLIEIKKGDMLLLTDDWVYVAVCDATSAPSKYPPAPYISVSCRVATPADFA